MDSWESVLRPEACSQFYFSQTPKDQVLNKQALSEAFMASILALFLQGVTTLVYITSPPQVSMELKLI